jgi:hypothetical protein
VEQSDLLRFTIERLEALGITYMLVGSISSGAYGEPRMTQDIDVVIDVSAQEVKSLCAAFPSDQFYVSADAALQALSLPFGQFNVIHPESGDKIDFMIARRDPWGREQVSRRRRIPLVPGLTAFAARPEDVIIGKLLYYQEGGSEKHLRDIAGILKVSDANVDRDYVARWSKELGVSDIWHAILSRLVT